jgi:diguanylate cyclase (GGDEF)-like protein
MRSRYTVVSLYFVSASVGQDDAFIHSATTGARAHPFMALGSIASSLYVVAGLLAVATAAIAYAIIVHRRLRAVERVAEQALEMRRQVENDIERLTRQRFALETSNQRLKRLVAVDSLTGIANRRHFDRALARELRRTRRDKQPLSLIFLDLDEFKRFNDTYGHAQGDDVLRKVAQTLDETFRRGGDLVARYGGEEFAVILPNVDGKRAALYAERLRRRIWTLSIPYGASQTNDRVTISGGVATLAVGRSAASEQILLVADRALYRAKCLGKNRIVTELVDPDSLGDSSAIGMAS